MFTVQPQLLNLKSDVRRVCQTCLVLINTCTFICVGSFESREPAPTTARIFLCGVSSMTQIILEHSRTPTLTQNAAHIKVSTPSHVSSRIFSRSVSFRFAYQLSYFDNVLRQIYYTRPENLACQNSTQIQRNPLEN